MPRYKGEFYPKRFLPKIYGQKQYIQEALSNLIDNAIKYTPSKGFVSVSITKKENNVIISIEELILKIIL